MMQKPIPIIFKLNSVQLDRASAATLSKNMEYASDRLLTEDDDGEELLSRKKSFEVIDQSSSA